MGFYKKSKIGFVLKCAMNTESGEYALKGRAQDHISPSLYYLLFEAFAAFAFAAFALAAFASFIVE